MANDTAIILIIDDQENSEHALPVALQQLGHTVITVNHAARGIEMAGRLVPEIIFLTLSSREYHWPHVLSSLSENVADTPVITFAEDPPAEEIVLSFQMGAFDCLLIPLSTDEELRQLVNRALNESRQRKQDINCYASDSQLADLKAELIAVREKLNIERCLRRYEQAIAKENKRILNIMFDNTHDVVIHLNRDGVVLNINDVIEDLFGLKPADVLGKNLGDHTFLGPDYMQALELYKAASPDIPLPVFELEAFRKDGTKVYIEVQAKQVLNNNNEIEGIINIVRDITPQRRLENAKNATILGMAKLAESRDDDTGRHLERIQEYVRIIAQALRLLPKYATYITPEYIKDIYHSSILHDIGKVSTPDAILLKPEPLSPDEFEIIKQHTVVGGNALAAIDTQLQGQSFLTLGKEIAYHHHEAWDGSGYPAGLKGEEIPLSARIVAIADVYDALTAERVYKAAFSHQKAVEIILNDRGKKFDPDIVDAFMANQKEIDAIRQRLCQATTTSINTEEPRESFMINRVSSR